MVPRSITGYAQNLVIREGTIFGFLTYCQAVLQANSGDITPYINSSIIIQLLTVAIPKQAAQRRRRRKKIVRYTRYGTILAFLQATGLYFG